MTPSLRQAHPVALWRFAIPVALGTIAGGTASFVVRRAMHEDRDLTRDAVAAIAHTIGFWLVGGLSWVWLAKRPDQD